MIIIDTKCIDGVYTPTSVKVEKSKIAKSRKIKKQVKPTQVVCEPTIKQSPLEDFISSFAETCDVLESIARRL